MDKTGMGEKAAFVLHKMIFGVIYHGAVMFLNKFQNTVLRTKGGVLGFLGYFMPILLLIWFFDVSRKKSTWKPFGKYSETIEIIIVLLTMLVLYITIGIV